MGVGTGVVGRRQGYGRLRDYLSEAPTASWLHNAHSMCNIIIFAPFLRYNGNSSNVTLPASLTTSSAT